MKILIAVPTFENIFPDTYRSIWTLDKAGHDIDFEFVRGYDCATARNNIAQMALSVNADYVLMVDNDVVLPEDALVNLLEDPVEVCLGYYAHRGEKNEYTGRMNVCRYDNPNEFGFPYRNYPFESEYTAQDLEAMKRKGITKLRIHGGGMGCALIRTDVFRRTEYPWYDWLNKPDPNEAMLSEDLFFCERCKQADIPVHTDVRVGCGHMLRKVQWPE